MNGSSQKTEAPVFFTDSQIEFDYIDFFELS